MKPCVVSCTVPACDGEDNEGVLVRKRSRQIDGPAHQEDTVSARRGGGCQDVSGQAAKRRAQTTLP